MAAFQVVSPTKKKNSERMGVDITAGKESLVQRNKKRNETLWVPPNGQFPREFPTAL
jgi:hypothetical protein